MNTRLRTEVLQYPIFRHMCPELSDDQFVGMQIIVMGWLFGGIRVPKA